MKIADVEAFWLQCPLPEDKQHVSDFGRLKVFDGVLVVVTTDDGRRGYGESKAGVGSSADCAALVTTICQELRPLLVGEDPRQISRLWGRMYNGVRRGHAERRGRVFPVLGRRGVLVSAMSGIDLALWDLLGKAAGMSVLDLVGGPSRERIPGYASGGWADTTRIGAELGGYLRQGFRAAKMRIGAMDTNVASSVARVREARRAIGPDVDLMVDAHGTFSTPEAKSFCAQVADLGLRWIEEPVSPDNRQGAAEVRCMSTTPIAAGESEFTCFDFQDLLERRAVDVLQPDLAICGGFTEGLRIGALAVAHQVELAPHAWGSTISFVAGLTLAMASPAGVTMEVCMGANPLLHELFEESVTPNDGFLLPPSGPGWGLTPKRSFIDRYTKT